MYEKMYNESNDIYIKSHVTRFLTQLTNLIDGLVAKSVVRSMSTDCFNKTVDALYWEHC